jgi:hypothetical protein
MYAGPRALDAAAMNVRADRRRKNESSSVRLVILAAASRHLRSSVNSFSIFVGSTGCLRYELRD